MFRRILQASQYGFAVKAGLLMDEANNGGGGGGGDKPFDFMNDDFETDDAAEADKVEPDNKHDDAASGADPAEKKVNLTDTATVDDDKKEGDDDDFSMDSFIEKDTEGTEPVTFDEKVLNSIAKEFDLLGTDDNASVKTLDDLKVGFNKKLEASRKQVNLDEYHPEARMVISMLENGGSVDQIYTNDVINEAQSILAFSDEEKVLEMKVLSLINIGYSPEKAESEAEQIISGMSPEVLAAEAERINVLARESRATEVKRLVDERKIHNDQLLERNTQQANAEKASLLELVSKTDSFMDIPLGDKTKAMIVKAINDGTFHNELAKGKAGTLLDAFLMRTVGKQILNEQKRIMEAHGYKNMMAGMKKVLQHLPKEGEKGGEGSSHSGGSASSEGKNFSWKEQE